jgi:histidine triad (HIT) family protein
MTAYDGSNIFAKILRGEIPCHKIYEDEHTLAFMDIMPQSDGHALVITKAPSRNLLDADPSVFVPLFASVQKVARAAQKAFKVDGVLIKQFNEAAAGQTVFHLHVHVIPRPEGTALKPHSGQMADHGLLAQQAELYRAALKQG